MVGFKEEFFKMKDYLILDVLEILNVKSNVLDYYHIGQFALLDAVQRYSFDESVPFDPYARGYILYKICLEMRSENRKSTLLLTLMRYTCGQASLEDVIGQIDLDEFYSLISSLEFKIIKLSQSGYSMSEISEIISVSDYILINTIKDLVNRLLEYLTKTKVQ